MEKEYQSTQQDPEESNLNEPLAAYGTEVFYDIPEDILNERIKRSEEDVKAGRVYTLEEARKIILG